jgi:hypothetical protein
VLKKELRTDGDLHLFALRRGFRPSHARHVLIRMLKKSEVAMAEPRVRPRISLDGYKAPRSFEVLQNGNL